MITLKIVSIFKLNHKKSFQWLLGPFLHPLLPTLQTPFSVLVYVLLSNTMSLAPKIDEIILCIIELKPDLACFSETWLHDIISVDCIDIPGYNLICKNQTSGVHGGVCLYIRNLIKFKTLNHLHHPDFDVAWAHIRPKKSYRSPLYRDWNSSPPSQYWR